MSIPFSVQHWLGDQAVPLFFIGFSLLMGVAIVYLSAQNRRSSLLRNRAGRDEDTFVDDLYVCGFDPDIARPTYRYLQEHQDAPFPIEPLDDLDRDLGLDSEDLDQTIRDLFDETGREYLPGLLDFPLVKVVDLVRTIQASPRRDETPSRRIA